MANDVSFSIKVNGTQATTTTNKVRQQFYSLNDVINQTGKNITQVNQQLSTVDKTMKRPTAYDTVGRADNAINKFGRTIKSLRVHGIDPATNSVARFINVVGGGMFNTVTLTITAIMSLFYALKKVNSALQDYFGALGARSDTLLKISKQRVKDTQEEGKQIQKVIDELKQMNEKQKLSNIEKNIALTLVQQIKNKWSDVGIQIDKNTGKIKNFNEVQAKLNKKQIEEQSKELETQIQLQNTKLDLTLSKYTGKTSIFSQILNGGNPADAFKAFDIFRNKSIEDITALDLFPGWINNYDDKEAVKKIDMGKLFFGDTQTQKEFFKQVASHLTNLDAFNSLNEIIDGLTEKNNLQKLKDALVDPTGENVRRAKQIQKSFAEGRKNYDKAIEQVFKIKQADDKFYGEIDYQKLTTEQKLNAQRRRYNQADRGIAEYNKLAKAYEDRWKDNWVVLENGQVSTNNIEAVKKNSEKVGSLYSEYQKIQQKYQPQINKLIASRSLYDEQKYIFDTYKRQMSNKFRFSPLTYSYEEAHKAQQWIREEGPRIEKAWDELKNKMAEERQKAFDELKLQGNDERWGRLVDEEQNKLDEYNRDTLAYNNNVKVLDYYAKERRQALSQEIKLQKQLAEQRAAAIQAMQDEFAELEKMVAEEAKVTQQRKSFLTGMGNDVIAQFMRDTGQEYSLRRQQIERQIMQELGVTSLNANQKSIAGRLAYIEQLQNEQQMNDRMDTFKYGVKTNELASKGGWSSSVYVSGRDTIAQQNLKVNQNQLKIQQQIGKLLPELKKQMNTLNKNLQI